MPSCSAVKCKSNYKHGSKENVSFHTFPADHTRKKEWCVKVSRLDGDGKLWIASRFSRICSVGLLGMLFYTLTKAA